MTQIQKLENFELHESDVTAVADPVTLEGLPVQLPHLFLGIQFFDDAGGTSQVTPGAGTVAIAAETVVNPGVFEGIGGSPMDATAPTTLSWDSNTKSARATPTGITTATHYKIIVSANRS